MATRTVKRRWKGRKFAKPKHRIGAGARGTAQRQIYRTGGGQRALAVWQSFGGKQRKPRRQKLKRRARQNPGGLTAVLRGVQKSRKKRGRNPVTGLKAGSMSKAPAPSPNKQIFTLPNPRPLRIRKF